MTENSALFSGAAALEVLWTPLSKGSWRKVARNALYKRLCTRETLQIGWHLAHADSRDDFLRDVVGYADFAASLRERIILCAPRASS